MPREQEFGVRWVRKMLDFEQVGQVLAGADGREVKHYLLYSLGCFQDQNMQLWKVCWYD
jgi:hypothetical protein